MAELDKKIQKSQPDLVQAVLDAQEKGNLERIDMLITNAIKQLKMSRFKPDQTACISLTYLARIKPKIFSQSNAIKEVLKSLLRRDSGPANLKAKNDILVPILAANILLACCDSSEVRSIILSKVEHWLSSNQKPVDLIQHLLATLCIKCQNDQQTVATLIEMRHHWLHYLEDNFEAYGPVQTDLCYSIKQLLQTETSPEYLIMYLKFLIKHDIDIISLGKEISKFINDRPMSLNSMHQEQRFGSQLINIIMKVYIKLINYLVTSPTTIPSSEPCSKAKPETVITKIKPEPVIKVKIEPSSGNDGLKDSKPMKLITQPIKLNVKTPTSSSEDANSTCNSTRNSSKSNDDSSSSSTGFTSSPIPLLYVKLTDSSQVITLDRFIIEAMLSLLATVDANEETNEEFVDLLNSLIISDNTEGPFFNDFALTSPYSLPIKIRQKLVYSSNNHLVDLALRNANPAQLVSLLHQFGTSTAIIDKILKNLELIKDVELIKCEIKDTSYFSQLMEFYSNSMGSSSAGNMQKRLEQTI